MNVLSPLSISISPIAASATPAKPPASRIRRSYGRVATPPVARTVSVAGAATAGDGAAGRRGCITRLSTSSWACVRTGLPAMGLFLTTILFVLSGNSLLFCDIWQLPCDAWASTYAELREASVGKHVFRGLYASHLKYRLRALQARGSTRMATVLSQIGSQTVLECYIVPFMSGQDA
jgi:hypothetical protein